MFFITFLLTDSFFSKNNLWESLLFQAICFVYVIVVYLGQLH